MQPSLSNPAPSSSPLPAPDPSGSARAAANRANSLHSTGPRTGDGKRRSSRNALTHGLTSQIPVLPSEDPEAYESHCRQFLEEYQPKTPTETQLVQELADTAWRLNRIPALEAGLLDRAAKRRPDWDAVPFDVPDPYRALAALGLHGQRLSRQFQKALDTLSEIQAARRAREEMDLERAAALLEFHKQQGLPYDPAQDGFVFSTSQIEAYCRRRGREKSVEKESGQQEQIRFLNRPAATAAAS